MVSSEGRRSFLLGITLNELSFIMFFLLMLISASTLQKTKKQLQKETQQKIEIQAKLVKLKYDSDQTFKRLQLIETRLIKAGGFTTLPSEKELKVLFTRLQSVNSKSELYEIIEQLQNETESLKHYKKVEEILQKNGFSGQTIEQFEHVVAEIKESSTELETLKGRLAYSQKKLKNSGLGFPPCWADPLSGGIEYLYTITLYEKHMYIEAAWPDHRKKSLRFMPNAEVMVGESMGISQFKQRVKPILKWSKANNCRHFVRIRDDDATSKEAFKRQMLVIEDYFYKYLIRFGLENN